MINHAVPVQGILKVLIVKGIRKVQVENGQEEAVMDLPAAGVKKGILLKSRGNESLQPQPAKRTLVKRAHRAGLTATRNLMDVRAIGRKGDLMISRAGKKDRKEDLLISRKEEIVRSEAMAEASLKVQDAPSDRRLKEDPIAPASHSIRISRNVILAHRLTEKVMGKATVASARIYAEEVMEKTLQNPNGTAKRNMNFTVTKKDFQNRAHPMKSLLTMD